MSIIFEQKQLIYASNPYQQILIDLCKYGYTKTIPDKYHDSFIKEEDYYFPNESISKVEELWYHRFSQCIVEDASCLFDVVNELIRITPFNVTIIIDGAYMKYIHLKDNDVITTVDNLDDIIQTKHVICACVNMHKFPLSNRLIFIYYKNSNIKPSLMHKEFYKDLYEYLDTPIVYTHKSNHKDYELIQCFYHTGNNYIDYISDAYVNDQMLLDTITSNINMHRGKQILLVEKTKANFFEFILGMRGIQVVKGKVNKDGLYVKVIDKMNDTKQFDYIYMIIDTKKVEEVMHLVHNHTEIYKLQYGKEKK